MDQIRDLISTADQPSARIDTMRLMSQVDIRSFRGNVSHWQIREGVQAFRELDNVEVKPKPWIQSKTTAF